MKALLLLFLILNILSADVLEDKGLYTSENTAYLADVKQMNLQELRFIYTGKLKVLNNNLPIKVLLKPLENKEQEYVLKHLLNIPLDQIKEEYLTNSNFVVINNQYALLIKLENTLGALSIIEDSIYFNVGDNNLVRIKVVE